MNSKKKWCSWDKKSCIRVEKHVIEINETVLNALLKKWRGSKRVYVARAHTHTHRQKQDQLHKMRQLLSFSFHNNFFLRTHFHAASEVHQGNDDSQQLLFTIITILNGLANIMASFTMPCDGIRQKLQLLITTVIHFSTPVNQLVPDLLAALTWGASKRSFYKPNLHVNH